VVNGLDNADLRSTSNDKKVQSRIKQFDVRIQPFSGMPLLPQKYYSKGLIVTQKYSSHFYYH